METLILGWYVLVETRSVVMLTVFASLQYLGNLIAPMFGVMGDRIGHRDLLCFMRAVYAICATSLMTLAFMNVLTPLHVMVLAAIMGLVRPSDIGMRIALVGETIKGPELMGAMGIQRTTQDSAKIAGALSGAGLVATLGMGPAYSVVASLYAISFLLTLRAGGARFAHRATGYALTRHPIAPDKAPAPLSPWRDLRDGLAYVWRTPFLRAVMCLAFALNATAFPLVVGLLPYVAKEVYRADQTVLGYMVASFAAGALLGSIILSRIGHVIRPARMTLVFSVMWYVMLFVLAQQHSPAGGMLALVFAGYAQATCQIPMATMLLRNSDVQFRGRIMGIRMLAIYGNVPGLLIAGWLIGRIGYQATASVYCVIGVAFAVLIAVRWRACLWRLDAPANRR